MVTGQCDTHRKTHLRFQSSDPCCKTWYWKALGREQLDPYSYFRPALDEDAISMSPTAKPSFLLGCSWRIQAISVVFLAPFQGCPLYNYESELKFGPWYCAVDGGKQRLLTGWYPLVDYGKKSIGRCSVWLEDEISKSSFTCMNSGKWCHISNNKPSFILMQLP